VNRHVALLLLSFLVSFGSTAGAGVPATVVYCIDDSTEFTSVLTALNNLPSHSNNYELRFRPGTFPSNTSYPVAANVNALIAWRPRWVTTYDQYTFKISGEWNAGCTSQNAPGGTTSTINGLDLYAIFYVDEVSYTDVNHTPLLIEIDRIDFWRFAAFGANALVAGGGHDLRISASRFRSGTGMAVSADADAIVIQNSLFESNAIGNFINLVDIDSEGLTLMANNTFRNNSLAGSSRRLVGLGNPNTSSPSGVAIFENNIIYQTTMSASSDLLITDTLARIKNNIFDTTSIYGSPLFISDNYNVDPKFAFAAGAQLQSGSPARDLGNNASANGATIDLYGRARIQNLVVDIGAYELAPIQDSIFAHAFE